MSSRLNPWAELTTPKAGQYTRLRVNVDSHHDMFWVRDDAGRPGLLVEVEREVGTAALRAAGIALKNVQVEVMDWPGDGFHALMILLSDPDKTDIFSRLCDDIAGEVTVTAADQPVFAVVRTRLKKWQALFASSARRLLSAEEVRGLFAELQLLIELLDRPSTDEAHIVRGWRGPDKEQHDFVLNNSAIEVKSVSSEHRGAVRISSEDQLYSPLERLYLRVYILAEMRGTLQGEDLNMLVHRVKDMLESDEVRQQFEASLTSAGYLALPEYDQPRFMVRNTLSYAVADGFPRLIRPALPAGVQAVSYDMLLTAAEPFRVADAEILEY